MGAWLCDGVSPAVHGDLTVSLSIKGEKMSLGAPAQGPGQGNSGKRESGDSAGAVTERVPLRWSLNFEKQDWL